MTEKHRECDAFFSESEAVVADKNWPLALTNCVGILALMLSFFLGHQWLTLAALVLLSLGFGLYLSAIIGFGLAILSLMGLVGWLGRYTHYCGKLSSDPHVSCRSQYAEIHKTVSYWQYFYVIDAL